ncbi:MAG: HAMP domain-containing sensor histidine kinase [Pseudomonadota bacterium]
MRFDLKKIFQESITVQIFTVFTLLIFSISASFSTLAAYNQQKTLLGNLQENGELLTTSLAFGCRIGVFTENIGFLSAPIEGVLQQDDVMEVSIFNNKGKLLLQKFGADQDTGRGRATVPPSLIPEDFFRESRMTSSIKCQDHNDCILFWAPVMPGSDFSVTTPFFEESNRLQPEKTPLGFIRICISKASVKKQLTTILLKDFFVCLCFLLLGTFITYFLATRITRPLKRLTRGVSISGEEGLLQKLPVESGNEIGKLTVAFNRMFVSLKAHLKREIDHARELTHARNLAVLGTAAGKVTHEVGNLINNIGLAILLLKKEALSERGRNALEVLHRESDRVRQFTRNFLQFAKKIDLYPEKKSLNAILEDLKEVHQLSAAQRNIQIEVDYSEATQPVFADHRLLYQALNNLVKNSIEAIDGEGGRITIRANAQHETLILSVADTGVGMTDDTRMKIFEPFFTTKGKGGTGLGMTITHSIVEAHGGRIECRSEEGKGTEFVIHMPLR